MQVNSEESGVEYRFVWLVFFMVLFLLGMATAVFPKAVVSVLRPRHTISKRGYLVGFEVLGGFVAVISIAEIVSLIKWEHLL